MISSNTDTSMFMMQEMDSLIKGRAFLLSQKVCMMDWSKAEKRVKDYWHKNGSLKGFTVLIALSSF